MYGVKRGRKKKMWRRNKENGWQRFGVKTWEKIRRGGEEGESGGESALELGRWRDFSYDLQGSVTDKEGRHQ